MSRHYDVFISYRTVDGAETAEKVFNFLHQKGYRCFYDNESIERGHDYGLKIINGVRHSRFFVLILTKGYIERCADEKGEENWVREELECALHPGWFRYPPRIVPITMEADGFKKEIPQEIALFRHPRLSHQQISTLPANKEYFKPVMETIAKEALGGWRYRWIGRWLFQWHRALILGVIGLILLGLIIPDDDSEPQREQTAEVKSSKVTSSSASSGKISADGKVFHVRSVEEARAAWKSLRHTSMWGEITFDYGTLFFSKESKNVQMENDVERRVASLVEEVKKEVLKFKDLGMRKDELEQGRPDVIMKIADIRLAVTAKLQGIIDSGDYEKALIYYKQANDAFKKCGLCSLDRPDFKPQREKFKPRTEHGK